MEDLSTRSGSGRRPLEFDFFRQSQALFVVGRLNGQFLEVNPQWTELFGWSNEELTGKAILDFVHAEDRSLVQTELTKLSEGQKVDKIELRFKTKSGGYRWLGCSATPHLKKGLFYGLGKDITEQHEQKAFSDLFFERSAIGLNLCKLDGTWIHSNPAFLKIIGYTQEEADAKLTYWDLTPRRYDTEEQIQLERLAKEGVYGPYQKEFIKKDGSLVPVLLHGFVVERNGESFIWSSIEDLTERVKLEKVAQNAAARVAASQEFLQQIIDAAPTCICVRSIGGQYTLVNKAFEDTVGKVKEDILGKSARELFSEDFAKSVDEDLTRIIKTKLPFSREHGAPGEQSASQKQHLFKSVFPLVNKNGELEASCSFASDITAQKREQSEISQVMAAINAAAIVTSTDIHGKILDVNQSFCEISGYSREELIDHDHRIINSGTHPKAFFKEMWNTIQSGKIWRGEIRNKAKDGSFYWVQTVMAPIFDLTGQIKKFLAIRFDITLQKEAQQKIIESEKMFTLGQMAAGVAHEINSPLFVVGAKIKKLLRQIEANDLDSKTLETDLGKLQKHIDRIAKIIKGLKLFSRNADEDPFVSYSVDEIINDSLELCRERYKAHSVDLKVAPIPDLKIECRPTQISQVILNLLTNSFDAISNLPEKWIEVSVRDAGPYVAIKVRDSGNGVPKDLAVKIMQPFFTTKEFGKGTGLGLSISRGIIESHEGHLFIDPHDKNTCFVIELLKGRQGPSRSLT